MRAVERGRSQSGSMESGYVPRVVPSLDGHLGVLPSRGRVCGGYCMECAETMVATHPMAVCAVRVAVVWGDQHNLPTHIPLAELAIRDLLDLHSVWRLDGRGAIFVSTCWSTTELVMLALAVYREARGEIPTAQIGVAWCIRNRVENPKWWGKDYLNCLFKKWQISSLTDPKDQIGRAHV